MIGDPTNKVAVVTGGTSGIGRAMAARFVAAGMRVAVAGSRLESVERARAEFGETERFVAVQCDVSDPQANVEFAAEVEETFGGVNLVCLNAGIARIRAIPDTSFEEWCSQLATNLDSAFLGLKAFLPLLERETEAHVVFTSSTLRLAPGPFAGTYYMSKAAVLVLAECLNFDLEVAGSHIGVSCLLPGNTDTGMARNNATPDQDPELLAAVEAELASGTSPDVVADAVLDAARENRFYVFPNSGDHWDLIEARFDRIREEQNPVVDDTSI